MHRFAHVAYVLCLVSFAGCGSVAVSDVSYSGEADSSEYVTASASPASYDSSGGSYGEYREAAPEAEVDPSTRPGLATQWGEARASSVRTVQFHRAHPSQPTAIGALHYNDAQGAAAQAALRAGTVASHVGIGGPQHNVLFSLVDEAGAPLPAYNVNGRSYVVGEPGRRYAIRLENRSPWRFEAVVSVDGLDVVDGREASMERRGYLLHPGQVVTIEGFRTSTTQVAAFRFGAVGTSYAAQTTGSARNVGVVGVALFAEAGVAVDLYGEALRREQANPFPGQFAAPPPNQLVY